MSAVITIGVVSRQPLLLLLPIPLLQSLRRGRRCLGAATATIVIIMVVVAELHPLLLPSFLSRTDEVDAYYTVMTALYNAKTKNRHLGLLQKPPSLSSSCALYPPFRLSPVEQVDSRARKAVCYCPRGSHTLSRVRPFKVQVGLTPVAALQVPHQRPVVNGSGSEKAWH
ncbi:hypothetical protein EDB85DRAFT_2241850 [Lactarius pseudohatsudake]|nr:hypothetical protein EDB85DRAFT_2241850 [Lactarius pseudohatsudake]